MAKGCFLHTYTKSIMPASHGEESVKIILFWKQSRVSGEDSHCTVFQFSRELKFQKVNLLQENAK